MVSEIGENMKRKGKGGQSLVGIHIECKGL
jgi:hypothetical protein